MKFFCLFCCHNLYKIQENSFSSNPFSSTILAEGLPVFPGCRKMHYIGSASFIAYCFIEPFLETMKLQFLDLFFIYAFGNIFIPWSLLQAAWQLCWRFLCYLCKFHLKFFNFRLNFIFFFYLVIIASANSTSSIIVMNSLVISNPLLLKNGLAVMLIVPKSLLVQDCHKLSSSASSFSGNPFALIVFMNIHESRYPFSVIEAKPVMIPSDSRTMKYCSEIFFFRFINFQMLPNHGLICSLS